MRYQERYIAMCIAVLEDEKLSAFISCPDSYPGLVCAEICAVFVLYIKILPEIHALMDLRLGSEGGVYLGFGLVSACCGQPYIQRVRFCAVIKHL